LFQASKITPEMLEDEGSWDPVVLCGPMYRLLASQPIGSLDTWGARVVDGSRGSEKPMVTATQIVFGELSLDTDSLLPAPNVSRYRLETGDVLLGKAPPIRAAWICPSVHHHHFDATCYAVRNLKTSQGIWLAFCLNQPEYSSALVRRSVASASPRINSTELKRFAIPDIPEGFELLADGIADCLDRRALSSMELLRLQAEVAEQVGVLVPEEASRIQDEGSGPSSWSQWFAASALEDSLVPGHVKAGEYQQVLRHRADWRTVNSLIHLARGDGRRLGSEASEYRCLRHSDVGNDLRVPALVSRGRSGYRNVYAEPLESGEVLHSLLATSPRTVFVAQRPEPRVYPTDHWVRLRFTETPGAWALTMQTEPIARQLRYMATGIARQFATISAVEQLVLPPVPISIRQSWDSRLVRWQRQRKELDGQWLELVDRVHGLLKATESLYGPWVETFLRSDE